MQFSQIIKQKKFIFHFVFYSFIIFLIITINKQENFKLILMIFAIIESYFLVVLFKHIGYIITLIYNFSGFLVIFKSHHFLSLYFNSILAYIITTVIAITCIYEYVRISDNYKKELLKLSTIDYLCGIYNNRYYKQRIIEEISRARRFNSKIGLLIFDIDKFKKINDTYGHYKGDLVLKGLSNKISEIIRTEDVFCRYAGDEFIIIITDYNTEISNNIFTRINNLLNTINTENLLNIELDLSISIGLSIYPDDAQNEIELFKTADHSLYESKKHKGTVFTSFNDLIN